MVALAFGVLYLLFEPRPGDLAVHVFRAEHFGREGFAIWNGQWYGGHHDVDYSVLSAPISYLFGTRVVLVAACVACAALFERLVSEHFGVEQSRWAALWLGFGAVTLLATSRLPYALGTAFGLAAALALQRGRPRLAVLMALLSPLASPVAGLFTGMGGVACALGGGPALRRASHPSGSSAAAGAATRAEQRIPLVAGRCVRSLPCSPPP